MGRLRPGESLPVMEDPRPRLVVGRRKPTAQARAGIGKKSKGSGASEPVRVPPSRVRPESSSAAGGVTVEDTDALDCGVYFLPLKAPIFQCNVGHVVCSPCRDRLKATSKCHLCGVATSGYRRCDAMECLVESIRFPCLNAAYGYLAMLPYHDREEHSLTCLHRPCHCPGTACDFTGSTKVLADHFSSIHGWSCSSEHLAEKGFSVHLRDGFNFVLAERKDVALRNDDDDCEIDDHEMNDGAATSAWYLFLLNMERKQFGRAISVLCIHPDASGSPSPSKEIKCELVYSGYVSCKDGDQVVSHYQQSEFRVACTDLSNGLPDLSERFQFIVPRFAYRDVEEDAIEVTVWLFIN